jgi:hypothetical protein
MIQSTLTAFIDQPQIVTVQSGLDTLTDAAVTRAYFRRMHEMKEKDAARDPQNAGPLMNFVAWVARGIKLFRKS